jgi:hypothetical protein
MDTLSNWFWGTPNTTTIIECDTRLNTTKNEKGKHTHCTSISYDPNKLKQQKVTTVSMDSLRNKVKLLSKFYENNYELLLKTPKFWDELQKIKDFESRKSYHDIFIETIVGSTEPLTNKQLARYSDVIETVYVFACPLLPTDECKRLLGITTSDDDDADTDKTSAKLFEPNKDGFGFILF